MNRRNFIKSTGLFIPMVFTPQIIKPDWKFVKPIKIKGVFEAIKGDEPAYAIGGFGIVDFSQKHKAFKIGDKCCLAAWGGILPMAGGRLVKKEYIYA